MDQIISLKELRQDVASYAKKISKGDSFIVMKRSKPIFRIAPVEEEGWETVIDCTTFSKGGIPANKLLKILASL